MKVYKWTKEKAYYRTLETDDIKTKFHAAFVSFSS